MVRRLLYVARHGETDWNAAGRWQGHTDIPLNEKGHAQARALGEALRTAGLAGVVSSDLSRAHQTARIVAEVLGLAVAYVDPDLRERTLGPFEGLTREECAQRYPVEWKAWADERRPPEGAEHPADLAVRVRGALGRAAERVAREDAPALVVAHGGALRAVLAEALGVLPGMIENGGMWRVQWEGRIVRAEAV